MAEPARVLSTSMPKQPVSFLLQVLITGGTPVVKSFYNDGKRAPDPLPVNAGDRVAWFVQAVLASLKRTTPPYEVTFNDSSFFGVPSVTVPAGGISQFVTVQDPSGSVKYSVTATGFGLVLDPEIQSGSGSILDQLHLLAVTSYTVTWNVDSNAMTWSNGGGPYNFPLTLKPLDTVTFIAVSPSGAALSNFTITFQPANSLNPTTYASPFNLSNPVLSIPAAPVPTTVTDAYDSGNSFTFVATIQVGTATKTSLANQINMG